MFPISHKEKHLNEFAHKAAQGQDTEARPVTPRGPPKPSPSHPRRDPRLLPVIQEPLEASAGGRLALGHLPSLCVPGGWERLLRVDEQLDAAPASPPGEETAGLCLYLVSAKM